MDTATLATPQQVATALCDDLSLSDLMYAGDPARGPDRGYVALADVLVDHVQVALEAGMPKQDGTQETLDLIGTCADAISAEIIHRYVTKAREARK